jgi:hypothetical protein
VRAKGIFVTHTLKLWMAFILGFFMGSVRFHRTLVRLNCDIASSYPCKKSFSGPALDVN